jgi:hypothetical protein
MVTQDNTNRWKRTWIEPWWVGSFKDLPYANEPFNDPVSLAHWQSLGYTQTKFTGDMYDMRNPEPAWMQGFRHHFPWKHFSWSVYRMGPGTVLPNHQDTYTRFKKLYNVTDDHSIHRAVVFLADWESGHYLEIDGVPITNWIAGDVVMWQSDVWHLAANCGMTDRYTLQITGVPLENPFLQ